MFYPVTNEQYAVEIASRWNVRESGSGYVTRFRVKTEFIARYDIHCVGAEQHTEWWIPAEDVEELNDNIVGPIELVWSSDPGSAASVSTKGDEEARRDDTLRVRCDGPSNGWLAVNVTAGANRCDIVVSYTPNDFLLELVTALLSCAKYEGEAYAAHANTEPDVYVFTFLRRSANVNVTIREKRDGTACFSVDGTFMSVVVPFWRALRRLQTAFDEDQWRRRFPERDMAALTLIVQERKTSAG